MKSIGKIAWPVLIPLSLALLGCRLADAVQKVKEELCLNKENRWLSGKA